MNKISSLFFLFTIFFILSQPAGAEDQGVAKVLILKGNAKYRTPNDEKYHALGKGTWLPEGTHVKTAKSSFVKLLFIDKSTMNVGPNSSMAIKKFTKKDAGSVSLIKGQIRAKVTKNYLEMRKKKQSKLFIKTKSAALGVRGTDFHIAYNPTNDHTSLLTFEGEVAFVKLSETTRNTLNQNNLDRELNSQLAVRVNQGQYSAVGADDPVPAQPVQVNPVQLETLKANDVGVTKVAPAPSQETSSTSETSSKKIIQAKTFGKRTPPGVSASQFSPKEDLSKQIGENFDPKMAKRVDASLSRPSGQLVDRSNLQGGALKVGEFGDLRYVPPPPNAEIDPNTGLAILSNEVGNIEENGNFTETKNKRRRDQNGRKGRFGRSPASLGGATVMAPSENSSTDQIDDLFAPGSLPQDDFINSAPPISPNDFGRVFINIHAQ